MVFYSGGALPTAQRAVGVVMGRRRRRPSGASRIAKTALLNGQRRPATIGSSRNAAPERTGPRRRFEFLTKFLGLFGADIADGARYGRGIAKLVA
jgi:hypothetical protein